MKQTSFKLTSWIAISLLSAVTLLAQDRPVEKPSPGQASVIPSLSKKTLASRGFRFDGKKWPMCRIEGPDGPCEVEAFVMGETNKDDAAHTCAKLDRSTYQGHCVGGKLDGLSLVSVDGTAKNLKETFISYFIEGRMAYPAVTSFLSGDPNLGAQDIKCKIANFETPTCSYGCVYFGKWDRSADRCALFSQAYGVDLFTEENAKKLRDGTFDLDRYRVKFSEFFARK